MGLAHDLIDVIPVDALTAMIIHLGTTAISALFHFAHHRKVKELGHRKKRNATKLNIDWWRRIRPGQRNPPVTAKRADMRRETCSKLLTFPEFYRVRRTCPPLPGASGAK